MAEWPKEVENPDALGSVVEVIPADLGRELAMALHDAIANGGTLTPATKDALLRYEREVGK